MQDWLSDVDSVATILFEIDFLEQDQPMRTSDFQVAFLLLSKAARIKDISLKKKSIVNENFSFSRSSDFLQNEIKLTAATASEI